MDEDDPPIIPGSPMPPPPPAPAPDGSGYGLGPGIRQGPPPASRPSGVAPHAGSRLPGVLVLAGGLAVMIGVFLPWLRATGPGGSVTENGLRIGTYGTLILGGFATARGASLLRPDTVRMQMGTPVIGGVLIAILVALRWGDLQAQVRDASVLPGFTASIGIGVWVVIAGAAAIVIGGLMSSARARLR